LKCALIGIVLITMFTGQLVHHQGSLARAALPYVLQLRWGWHRAERVMERGQVSLEALFEQALTWCVASLPVEPVRLGSEQRAVQANLVAALTTVVLIGGIRVGVVRRTRFGATCQEAVANLCADVPARPEKRLFSVDAGIATIEQFRAATERDALVGRLRKNVTLRRAPAPKPSGQRGRAALHGPVVHPGAKRPEGRPDEDTTLRIEDREVRRWRKLHFREAPRTLLDVVRVDDPAYKRPLLIGTTARAVDHR
jgi:hypothetical protein